MTRVRRMLVVLALAAATMAGLAQTRPLTLLVPPFDGPRPLGVNVATILNLQVWQTLRKAPYPNPSHLGFGDGLVTGIDRGLASQTHDAALHAAAENDSDLVLWGNARRYGSGVVVQSYLTIVPRTAPIWRVSLPSRGGPVMLDADLPRLRYEFRSIALNDDIVQRYSTPDALRLYRSRDGLDQIGTVGTYFTALEQGGNAALVKSGDVTGWIRLPLLSSNRSEVVDFAGGIMRILRADWSGADDLFTRVLANPKTPTLVKLDAHLYRVVALERSGSSGIEEARRAVSLNPYDRSTVAYLVMSEVAAANRLPAAGAERAAMLADARRLLDSNRFLFPAADPWIARTAAALDGQ